MAITIENIVSVLNSFRVDIKLTDAFKLGADLMSLIRTTVDEAYSKGLEAGKNTPNYVAIDKAYDDGYASGLERGKREALNGDDVYELNRLRNMEKSIGGIIKPMALEIVKEVGTDKKIQCIKNLRAKTFIGLKQAKDMIDEACKIVQTEMAYEEQAKRLAAEQDGFTESK